MPALGFHVMLFGCLQTSLFEDSLVVIVTKPWQIPTPELIEKDKKCNASDWRLPSGHISMSAIEEHFVAHSRGLWRS